MNMLDIHKDALDKKLASYHEFLAGYSKTKKAVYGFVEGKEDLSFYRGFIEQLVPDDWQVELWSAGNKSRVYWIHSALDRQEFPKKRIGFFVDRDLSDLIPEQLTIDINIYVTDSYSIENSVVERNMCRRILADICGFSEADHSELERVCDLFEQQLEVFLKSMIPIMASILSWRRSRENANLDNIHMKDLFSFSDGVLQIKSYPKEYPSEIAYIHGGCGISLDPSTDLLPLKSELITNETYRRFTRGKYMLWFLVEFCRSVREDALRLFKSLPKVPKMHLNLSLKNAMIVMDTRGQLPESLREFVNSTFCSYIEEQVV